MTEPATNLHVPSAPHIAVRPEWLALQHEAPLDAGMPIIDAHHHLWEFPEKSYRAEQFLSDMSVLPGVAATVFVECKTHYRDDGPVDLRCTGEMSFVDGECERTRPVASRTTLCAAAVAYADLGLGDAVVPVLDALAIAANGRLRSIRNIAVWHADPGVRVSAATPPRGLLGDAKFREGFAHLDARGLAFDAWLVHTQLEELHDLAGAFPATQIVLNHVGGPLAVGPYASQRAAVFAEWRDGMAALARCSNVAVKIGGFGMPLFGFDFHRAPTPPDSSRIAEAIGPYAMTCIDLFGAQRCMFESNFPVDKGSYNYGAVWNAFKRIAAKRGAADIDALFCRTAARIYRIPGQT